MLKAIVKFIKESFIDKKELYSSLDFYKQKELLKLNSLNDKELFDLYYLIKEKRDFLKEKVGYFDKKYQKMSLEEFEFMKYGIQVNVIDREKKDRGLLIKEPIEIEKIESLESLMNDLKKLN